MGNTFAEGFTRLHNAVNGIPDRVPFVTQMHEFAMIWSKKSARRFYTDADLLVTGLLKTAEDFQFDIPNLGYDVYNIEAEALGHELVFHKNQPPSLSNSNRIIQTKKDLLQIRPPEPGTSGRMKFVLTAIKHYLDRTGVTPDIQFCAPFSLACLLRGYDVFIGDIFEDPEFAHDFLSIITDEIIAPWVNHQKQKFPASKCAIGADAYCSPPMVTLDIIRKFSLPYILKLRKLCNFGVAVRNWWGESFVYDIEKFLALKLQAASGILKAQDPDVEKLGPSFFKDFSERNNLTLELGIGDSLLNTGPVEKINQRIKAYLEAAAPGGRFVLYFSTLDANTPPDNIRAAVDAVKKYGCY